MIMMIVNYFGVSPTPTSWSSLQNRSNTNSAFSPFSDPYSSHVRTRICIIKKKRGVAATKQISTDFTSCFSFPAEGAPQSTRATALIVIATRCIFVFVIVAPRFG